MTIEIDIANTQDFIKSSGLTETDIDKTEQKIKELDKTLKDGTCAGGEFTGWTTIPSKTIDSTEIIELEEHSAKIKKNFEAVIIIGIGGSYLGSRSAIEFYSNPLKAKSGLEIYFAGHNISSEYMTDLLATIRDKEVHLLFVSKSGSTLEPTICFNILRNHLVDQYGDDDLKSRITIIGDSGNNNDAPLKKYSTDNGHKFFPIPANVGGRYSVLTPAGLLPMELAGINIKELIKGARECEASFKKANGIDNPAYLYAALRHLLYKGGNSTDHSKKIEVMSLADPTLYFFGEWWKQLSGESGGKDGLGIFPATLNLTTDLHSIGQLMQDGERNMFETFLTVQADSRPLSLSDCSEDLKYLEGKSLHDINTIALEATASAHKDGGVPNMTISIKNKTPFSLGYLYYFFQRAIAMTALLNGVNPFDQPGVEAYKQNLMKGLK